MPTASQFQAALDHVFLVAQKENKVQVDVEAGALHRDVGDYPDPRKHRMPVCCNVMRQNMQDGDTILQAPPKGNGASLVVRYKLPRR